MPVRPGCGIELTTRSDGADLPPLETPHGVPLLRPIKLLHAEAELDTFRIVEVFSRDDGPFQIELSWSAGSGSGASAFVTVARSARVCLFARSLRIGAANLGSKRNRIGVTVGDGFAVTENHFEVQGSGQGTVELAVPPFARRARLDMADPAVLATSVVRVLDGLGAPRGSFTGANQPPDGLPLGNAGAVQVAPSAAAPWRVVFTLSI